MTGTSSSSDDETAFSSACAVVRVGEKRKMNDFATGSNTRDRSVLHNNRLGSSDNGDAGRGEEPAQPKTTESVGSKFNDFGKLKEEATFAVGQTWALYDTADGMPRLYAQIRKVSAPSFGLRITYLEPDPDDEKEIQWFEEDLPVSVGKFRLGQNQNTKDRSRFSHLIHCDEGSNSAHFTVFPRKGETWALYKNWDISWSSEPDSHRSYEYDFVEILSDYADGAGVYVAFLHKAKGFASVFFRMGTGEADISQILPHSLYRFSHRVPSFKLTGYEGQGVPKDAYELDQAALPEAIEEILVPSQLTVLKSKPEALCFPIDGTDFQTGQIWSYYKWDIRFPVFYGRIEKITLTQAFEQPAEYTLRMSQLKATPFPEDVIPWDDKKMPVGCGTFSVMKGTKIFSPHELAQEMSPEISMDGKEYTILPQIGDVWAIYTDWTPHYEAHFLNRYYDYDIVEVLDDTSDYKVMELEPVSISGKDDRTFFKATKIRQRETDSEEDGSEVIFTIPKSKRLTFSHQIPASIVTKEIDGDLKELFEVDCRGLCVMNLSSDYRRERLNQAAKEVREG
ncbi:PREDICTED: uncharacterized protein LOC104770213 [Camelina sativa]|uniref:Uncharacterized protein LOC104770213 n=1 Tax=Camelina sativa TaxID=90675 RepID=A0ABM0XYN8_CAMSA|nr:PREDICTED: uncharacterized protein LOC104770213 [Camelina sativa]